MVGNKVPGGEVAGGKEVEEHGVLAHREAVVGGDGVFAHTGAEDDGMGDALWEGEGEKKGREEERRRLGLGRRKGKGKGQEEWAFVPKRG